MNKERQRDAFREEAYELVAELESALLELEQTPSDAELVQRIFRALHTIKGSGAMFGFDEISHFTHELENAFDRVREGKLAVTGELVNLTLAARDQIKAMLDESTGQGAADAAKAARILEDLGKLAGATAAAGSPAGNSPAVPVTDTPAGPARRWQIHFRPAQEIFLKGGNPLLLFRELAELGKLEATVHTDALPELARMDPERCYLGWDLVLETAQPEAAIRDVFLFVEDDSELTIAMETPPAAAQQTEAAATPADTRALRGATAGSTSLRVAAEKLDSLVNFVGELVVVQARLSALAARQQAPEVLQIAEEVERLTAGLRDNAMSIRMLPLRGTFDRFRRLVHDLTRDLGKEVEFSAEGGETELDKTVIDQLSDPLMHLIRNSMDHGLEPPEERAAAGKPPAGALRLSAVHSGASVLISVTDDGRGLNAEAIRARAIEKGLIAPDDDLSESDLHNLILKAGFSTARQVSDLSGRGVGMDVVARSVEALRGSLEIASRAGEGTTVTLRLPLTLAIIDGLLVRVGTGFFVVPVSNVVECVELSRADVREAHGRQLAHVRGELVPYIRLREHFRIPGEPPEIEQIMILETGVGQCGFAVDEVLGDHQTVIKNLGRFYRHIQMISGATILGDGTVALILDPQRILESAMRQQERRMRRNGGPAIPAVKEIEASNPSDAVIA